ncbi:MAG: excinuclease ABC subunit UvrA [Chitinophagaceae bacterium]|nr:MAG: excinuclease ABC subunit UvrA [Chitinophagaceae bacterium]
MTKAAKYIKTLDISEDTLKFIEVEGARKHNLRNINIKIPSKQLVVITGISGSGKSSLAFDTIYAEGQRRYIESFSAYARQFIGGLERPDVDSITGLSPVISIDQKTTSKNPRSTVGTVTEIYDFFRLLYARTAEAITPDGNKMVRFSFEQMENHIRTNFNQKKIIILAPLILGRKGHYRELFERILKKGFVKARIDGEVVDVKPGLQLDRYKTHDIEAVIDRIEVKEDDNRLSRSLKTAFEMGEGKVMIVDYETENVYRFSNQLMDTESGHSLEEPSPNNFSFNSPYGACPNCKGLGFTYAIDPEKIIPNENLSINKGAIAPIGELRKNYVFQQLRNIAKKYQISLSSPVKELPDKVLNKILYGHEVKPENAEILSDEVTRNSDFQGVYPMLKSCFYDSSSDNLKIWAQNFMEEKVCPECNGSRLKKEALWFKIDGKSIDEVVKMDFSELQIWINGLMGKLSERQKLIGKEVIKEIHDRLSFILEVGLDYLTLDRPAKSLSGGESQRIRLATQIGSQLTGITYILDEPSIGLHQRDNVKLIQALKQLRDMDNSILVVEHDKDIMMDSDYIIDIGPGAGKKGGLIVAKGTPQDFIKENSLTADYLSGRQSIKIPGKRLKGTGNKLSLYGATGHNLKNVDLHIPLGTFTCITGVSGSGKSSLINETLYPIVRQNLYNSKQKALPFDKIKGLDFIDKVIEIDQSPIGRTPRSNAVTYTGVFTDIRKLFAKAIEAQIRGYKIGRFSFNVKGGRCEECQGAGVKIIEMNFLPDVSIPCEKCLGKRYNRETLEVRFKGKSISDVLNMSVDEASEFFENQPKVYSKIKTLKDVGLGYISLGQSATTLSGGEAQRIKLATELSKKDTGNTLYILDEPTTGLHFEDIRLLLDILQRLASLGNTVIVIEHNMDVIKVADHIIDIGPEGGHKGGRIITQGTPEEVAKSKESHTATFLKNELL